jgi:hypothetical protein
MGHFLFFVSVVASCLLWSAACTAAAARTHRPWLRLLLEAMAVLAPVVALAPFVAFTGFLAFVKHMPTNWFGPTLTTFLSAFIGGTWIVWAGLARASSMPLRAEAAPAPLAARWPVVGLAAAFVMAKAVSFGTLLILDNAVAAQAPYLRLEAAQIMQANLPPAVADADNAATLYHQVLPVIDAEPAFKDDTSPLADRSFDITSPRVAEVLTRHRSTLDVIRRAADLDVCRFHRDWTRPSIAMLLPELQSLRQAARLLALAARREAADGNLPGALRDVVRLQQMGRHAAAEPILISSLVGNAIDTMALDTLTDVLPRLRKADLPALDAEGIRDLVATVPPISRSFYGEEAFGLATFADIADGRLDPTTLNQAMGSVIPFWSSPLDMPAVSLFRSFFLLPDIAGYRSLMHRYQAQFTSQKTYADVMTSSKQIEEEIRDHTPGMLSSLLVPALGSVVRAHAQNEARHRAASVLVAATRQRLETGELPKSLDDLVPGTMPAVPRDPFTADQPLLMKRDNATLLVYSIGPDGEDDGGPVAPGADRVEGNDDIGWRMSL